MTGLSRQRERRPRLAWAVLAGGLGFLAAWLVFSNPLPSTQHPTAFEPAPDITVATPQGDYHQKGDLVALYFSFVG